MVFIKISYAPHCKIINFFKRRLNLKPFKMNRGKRLSGMEYFFIDDTKTHIFNRDNILIGNERVR
jgi:hypothetical protein